MGDLPIKALRTDRADTSDALSSWISRCTEDAAICNSILGSECLDAPCMKKIIPLGPNNMANAPVYKVMTPGYFLRLMVNPSQAAVGNIGNTGVLVASEPMQLVGDSYVNSRLVYLAASDEAIYHANVLYPILPGQSTYAYIVRGGSEHVSTWYFVPTYYAAGLHIFGGNDLCGNSYCVPVGVPNPAPTLTGRADPSTISTIFQGNDLWNKEKVSGKPPFKSVVGWNMANEDALSFIGDGKATLVSERKALIDSLCAPRKVTTNEDGSGDVIYDYTDT